MGTGGGSPAGPRWPVRRGVWWLAVATLVVAVAGPPISAHRPPGGAVDFTVAGTVPDAAGGPGGDRALGPASGAAGAALVANAVPSRPRITGPVTLAFGGDVSFAGLHDRAAAEPATFLAAVRPLLAGADLAMVNLETAITDRGTPEDKEFTFRAPPAVLAALVAAGVDVVSVANNHGWDYGELGLIDTLTHLDTAGLAAVGGGHADRAYAPLRREIHGRQLALFGATQVIDGYALDRWTATDDRVGMASAKPGGLERLLDSVRRAAAEVDTVVVFLHWGVELQGCPAARQVTLAQQLADAGAAIVVGTHAHVLLGGGYLGDTLVHYGLGNFVFATKPGRSPETGVLAVTVAPDGTLSHEWRPAVQRGGVPEPLAGDQAVAAAARWEALRPCTALAPAPADPQP